GCNYHKSACGCQRGQKCPRLFSIRSSSACYSPTGILGLMGETIRASQLDRVRVAALRRGANACAASPERLPRTRGHLLAWLLASVLAALGTADAFSAARPKNAPPDRGKAVKATRQEHGSAPVAKAKQSAARQNRRDRAAPPVVIPLPIERPAVMDAAVSPPPDLTAAKQAIELVRRGQMKDATALAASIGDPAVAKLVEWALL